jgi:hypothetical protein
MLDAAKEAIPFIRGQQRASLDMDRKSSWRNTEKGLVV